MNTRKKIIPKQNWFSIKKRNSGLGIREGKIFTNSKPRTPNPECRKNFVLGGIRSGKTRYAIEKMKAYGKNIVYIATNIFYDDEMKKRIKLHKTLRPKEWRTIEEGKELTPLLNGLVCDGCIIDCLGVFITNLIMDGVSDRDIEEKLKMLANAIVKAGFPIILISNDVGSGLVPDNPLGRRFCDLMGIANQIMAEKLNSVVFLQAGIPIVIKGGKENVRRNN